MHITIDYATKPEQALTDAARWLSDKQCQAIDACLQSDITFEQFQLACSFTGIQGAPVRAIWDFVKAGGNLLEYRRTVGADD